MEKEVLFAETLKQVTETAKAQGNSIDAHTVEEAFAPLALSPGQLAMVFDYLKKRRISVGDQPAEEGAELSQEDSNYLNLYLEELGELEQLSDGEKAAAVMAAMAGEADAQEKLAKSYLANVVEIAKLYAGQGAYLEDLIGEGNLAVAEGVAMLGCLEHYSEADGMLGKMIMDAMEAHIMEKNRAGQLDSSLAERVNEVAQQAKLLSQELRRKVTPLELSEETGLSVDRILEAVRISGRSIEDIESA